MSDEYVQPTRVTVLQGDVRPPPRERGWSGSGRGLMIGVLGAVAVLIVAVLILVAILADRGMEAMQRERQAHADGIRAVERRLNEQAARDDRQRSDAPIALSDPATWITADDYPPSALRAHEEGTVTITWVATPDGRISDCKTLQSSGHDSLDRAACSAILRRGRYPAFPPEQGPRVFTRRVVWIIPA